MMDGLCVTSAETCWYVPRRRRLRPTTPHATNTRERHAAAGPPGGHAARPPPQPSTGSHTRCARKRRHDRGRVPPLCTHVSSPPPLLCSQTLPYERQVPVRRRDLQRPRVRARLRLLPLDADYGAGRAPDGRSARPPDHGAARPPDAQANEPADQVRRLAQPHHAADPEADPDVEAHLGAVRLGVDRPGARVRADGRGVLLDPAGLLWRLGSDLEHRPLRRRLRLLPQLSHVRAHAEADPGPASGAHGVADASAVPAPDVRADVEAHRRAQGRADSGAFAAAVATAFARAVALPDTEAERGAHVQPDALPIPRAVHMGRLWPLRGVRAVR